ncbi:MAG: SHOCT domain-containing protein [Actinomycetes bacterium]
MRQNPMTRRGWIWLIAAGFAVSVVGIIVGMQKAGPLCGSPLIPQSREAEIFDALRPGSQAAAECYRNIDAAAVPAWTLIALGIMVVLTGVIIRVVTINRFSTSAPSVAAQLDDLVRRHKEGLISTEEFNAKRVDLLKRL